MIIFDIDVNSVTWDVSENIVTGWSEEDTIRMNRYVEEISAYINQVLGIEHMLNSESIQLKLVGDNNIDIDFFVFKENMKDDLSTMKFYETLISRKDRILYNFKHSLSKLDKESIQVRWSDQITTLLDRIWVVGSDRDLHSYISMGEA